MFYTYNRCPCIRLLETSHDKALLEKINRIMTLGEERVNKHFNIVKLIKNLRDIKHVVIHHLNKAENGKNKDKFN